MSDNTEKLIKQLSENTDVCFTSRKRLLDDLFDAYPVEEEFVFIESMHRNMEFISQLVIPREESFMIESKNEFGTLCTYYDSYVTRGKYDLVKEVANELKNDPDYYFISEILESYEGRLHEKIRPILAEENFNKVVSEVMKAAGDFINERIIGPLIRQLIYGTDLERAEAICSRLFPAIREYFRSIGFYTIASPVIGEKLLIEQQGRYYSLNEVYNPSRAMLQYIVEITCLSYGSAYSFNNSDADNIAAGTCIKGEIGVYTSNNF